MSVMLSVLALLLDAAVVAPRVTLQMGNGRGSSALDVIIVSKGATVHAGNRSYGPGDRLALRTPATVIADLADGGVAVVSPADTAWVEVQIIGSGPTSMRASAAAVLVRFDGGKVWLRGIPRTKALEP